MDNFSFKEFLDQSISNLSMGAGLSTADILVGMAISLVTAMFVFFTYEKTYAGVLYQKTFNISLILMSLITTLVIMTISGNLILSLGMVGALSIVRFRTAVKDPLDIVFLFWAIAIGIANGVGYFKLSIIGSIFIAVVLFILRRKKTGRMPYVLIAKYNIDNENNVLDNIKQVSRNHKIKSRVLKNDMVDLSAEMRLKKGQDVSLLQELNKNKSIMEVSLISYSDSLSS